MDPGQMPVFQAGFRSTVRSPVEVRDWLEFQLASQLLAIPGVGAVEVTGGQIRELQVVHDTRLAAHGLTTRDVVAAIDAENRDVAAGNVTSEPFDVMAKTDETSLGRRYRGAAGDDANGAGRLRLELARVRDGHAEQRLSGEPGVQLTVWKTLVGDPMYSKLHRRNANRRCSPL
jgi:multidrug efflux pump subunit AcrB